MHPQLSIHRAPAVLLLAPLLACAGPHPDSAVAAPRPPDTAAATSPATWVGSNAGSGRPWSLRLSDSADGRTATLEFGEPYNCRVQATRSTAAAGSVRLAINDANGGYRCNALVGETAVLQVQGVQATLQLPGTTPVTVVLWKPGQATDGGADAVQGRWVGTVTGSNGRPIALRLRLAARDPGDRGSELAYDSPRSCRVPLRYEGTTAQGSWFSALPGPGGQACDRLLGHWLQVQADADATRLQIEPGIGECVPSCSLQRTP
ncbi:hypothetical protein [Stenotrophomonas sp. 24(2023)]|uniref:hypothetical protein n=1 Tax=Stenotrophomonas sp. 24(2023) TaxID=3068324 RepID=UPI0027DEFEB9|nr:hypothetical protein [Stenotrophomonas sp. 24(2023)]WMJ71051.1 hypothetical protein Q9R17_08165 [Stenotrophomonas sp. 24(2023)]